MNIGSIRITVTIAVNAVVVGRLVCVRLHGVVKGSLCCWHAVAVIHSFTGAIVAIAGYD
jgi:hypothetical protein